jgi:hypothetical protein
MRILSCVVMIRLVVFLGISNLRIIYKKSPFYFYLHNQYNTITNRDKDKSQRIKDKENGGMTNEKQHDKRTDDELLQKRTFLPGRR